MKCSNCGAGLSVQDPEATLATCKYCSAQTRIGPRGLQARLNALRPRQADGQQSGGKGCAIAIVGFVALMIMGISMSVFFFINKAQDMTAETIEQVQKNLPFPTPGVSNNNIVVVEAPRPDRVYWFGPACLVDADGADPLDIATVARVYGADDISRQPTILDGATGSVLWKGDKLGDDLTGFCMTQQWFGVQTANFEVLFTPARPPRKGPTTRLSDRVRKLAAKDDCVTFGTADRKETTLSLPGGAVSDCDAGKPTPIAAYSRDRTSRRRFELADRVIWLTARRRGTPVITVQADRGKERLWGAELEYQSTHQNIRAVLAGDAIVFVGGTRKATKRVLVGIATETGEIRFEIPLENFSTIRADPLYNGKVVLIGDTSDTLFAYDPKTGALAWRFGQ